MHESAMLNCQTFFETYAESFSGPTTPGVIEIGSQDVNGSLRTVVPAGFDYLGVDFVEGRNVDVVLTDPYSLPFESDSTDIVVSSSCFEHSEMFWLVFLDVMRILKGKGLFYLNVPSNGPFHRYPVDCWRFYPDSGRALQTWGRRNGIPVVMLESYTSEQLLSARWNEYIWNDFVAVFLKDERHQGDFPRRILDSKFDINNGLRLGSGEFMNFAGDSQDRRKLKAIQMVLNQQIRS